MAREDGFLDGAFQYAGRHVVAAHGGEHVDRSAHAEHLLHERGGEDDRAFDVAEGHHLALAFLDADDRELRALQRDDLARGVFAAREKVFPYLRADEAHPRFLRSMSELVDVAAEEEPLGLIF